MRNPTHLTPTLLLLLSTSLIQAQIVQVTYQEELEFAYLESESLIDQMRDDELIEAEFSYGYEIGKGGIRYVFDLDNQTVTREECNGKSPEWHHVDMWDILYIISPWEPETQHLSCVAITEYGEYLFEINESEIGEKCLLKSCKNREGLPIKSLPDVDWDVYNLGELSTAYGDFIIEVLAP